MPISPPNTFTPQTSKRQFDLYGVMYDDDFQICDRSNFMAQIAWNANPLSTSAGTVTLQVDIPAGNSVINLSTLSANQSNSFATIQPDAGTSPVAASPTDTLTITGTNVTVTGNSSTKTVALTLPVAATKPVLIPPSASISASAIDWSLGNVFYKTLGANTTFTFSNITDGQTIDVAVTNTASNWTVTWPTVSWSGGSAPTQTTGAHTDVYTFVRVNGVTYGSVVQNF